MRHILPALILGLGGDDGVWSYAIGVAFVLVSQGILIWISVKAKPLAGLPYRWGTYVGIITGFGALAFLLITLVPNIGAYEKGIGAVVGLCSTVCCIGILRRRKFGAVMFVIAYTLMIVVGPFLSILRDQPLTAPVQTVLAQLVFLIMTTIYFQRRWHVMGSSKPSELARISQATITPHQQSVSSVQGQPADVGQTLSTAEVKSTPEGAEITIDDKFVGNTPSTLRLQPGDYSIKIDKPGFKTWTRVLCVTSGSTATISAELESQ
jgi:hypothetical protein